MAVKKLIVFLAIIVEFTWSQGTLHSEPSRRKRDAPSIVYGNTGIQAQNNITINGTLPPGSQVIGGSVLNQVGNQYLTIAESGKLVVVMPNVIDVPDPLIVLGLNDSQTNNLLNLTQDQRNARIVYNLKQSLHAFNIYSVAMSQAVENYLYENSENADDNYKTRIWYSSLSLHKIKKDRMERTLNRLIEKIKINEAVTDDNVKRAREDANSVLQSHKKLAVKMQRVLTS